MSVFAPLSRPLALTPGWAKNELWRKARAVPSLDLRFAESKSLVDARTGQNLVTHTRASSATFVGSDGLIKTAVTNLLLRSEEFDNASWTPTALQAFGSGSIANAIAAPNSSITADLITENTASSEHNVLQATTVVASTTYTLSCYAKKGTRSILAMSPTSPGVSNYYTLFNLDTGVTVYNEVGNTPVITALGNGWYRCSITRATGAAQVSINNKIGIANNALSTTYAGDGTSGLYVWGAQLEQSSSVGEYVPTTSVINSAPRFDHNPTTGESLGLLVEEQRTNLVPYSEQLNDIVWGPVAGTVTANAETSPANTLTADKLIAANGGPAGQLAQGATITSGATVTGSIYAKAGGFDRLELVLLASNNTTPYGRSTFNPNTGVITIAASTSNGGTNASSAVQALSNGWYRFSVTVTYPAVTSAGMRLVVTNSDAANGDGVKGVFLWGAQLEAGAFPTSYIPTVGAGVITPGYASPAVTRAADVASITGSNFSSWYNQTEGTVFADVTARPDGLILVVDDGGFANRKPQMSIGVGSATDSAYVTGGSSVASFTQASTSNQRNLIATAYATDNYGFAANGGTPQQDSAGALPISVNTLRIGRFHTGSVPLYGTIKRLTYWPVRLSNTTLQQITQP